MQQKKTAALLKNDPKIFLTKKAWPRKRFDI